jgi:hypothetical protein
MALLLPQIHPRRSAECAVLAGGLATGGAGGDLAGGGGLMDEPHAFHSLRSLRYRRCPSCQVVLRASEFRRAQGPVHAPGQLQQRRCPACGHIGPLRDFPIVDQPEPDQEEPS